MCPHPSRGFPGSLNRRSYDNSPQNKTKQSMNFPLQRLISAAEVAEGSQPYWVPCTLPVYCTKLHYTRASGWTARRLLASMRRQDAPSVVGPQRRKAGRLGKAGQSRGKGDSPNTNQTLLRRTAGPRTPTSQLGEVSGAGRTRKGAPCAHAPTLAAIPVPCNRDVVR